MMCQKKMRIWLRWTVGCLVFWFAGFPSAVIGNDGSDSGGVFQDRPNVVLIISDDQRWSDYGFMEHPLIETPNLDHLARQSALFRRGYVPTALCRASLMTLRAN